MIIAFYYSEKFSISLEEIQTFENIKIKVLKIFYNLNFEKEVYHNIT